MPWNWALPSDCSQVKRFQGNISSQGQLISVAYWCWRFQPHCPNLGNSAGPSKFPSSTFSQEKKSSWHPDLGESMAMAYWKAEHSLWCWASGSRWKSALENLALWKSTSIGPRTTVQGEVSHLRHSATQRTHQGKFLATRCRWLPCIAGPWFWKSWECCRNLVLEKLSTILPELSIGEAKHAVGTWQSRAPEQGKSIFTLRCFFINLYWQSLASRQLRKEKYFLMGPYPFSQSRQKG